MFVFTPPEKADRLAYYYLHRANAKADKHKMTAKLILRILCIVLGCAGLATVMLLRLVFGSAGIGSVETVMVLLACLYFLFFGLFYYRICAWRGARLADRNSAGGRCITFSENEISMTDNMLTSALPYESVQRIFVKDGYYFLFISRNQALAASTAWITSGSAESFPQFLTEKTGLKIETI